MLFIVSTPIGNLKDITYRAVEVLKQVDLIAAEDTRHTKILTKHYEIDTPLTSYHDHNEQQKAKQLVDQLKQGKDIALVSDAGTPGINDPGYRVVHLAQEEGVDVTVIPGACAAIAALSLSGLPTDQFSFKGFLPVKSAARQRVLGNLKEGSNGTIIFYESCHRIIKALNDIKDVLDNPKVAVARELTKKFEELKYGHADELIEYFSKKKPKGEFVVLISGSGL